MTDEQNAAAAALDRGEPQVETSRTSAAPAAAAPIAQARKTCKKCGSTLNESDFYPHKKAADGLRSECKNCSKAAGKDWKQRRREKESINVVSKKHGHAVHGMESRTYGVWLGMTKRCRNKNEPNYKQYGGRGITVCERWLTFTNFLHDMGEAPPGLSIDRHPNNDGNYEPGNCRWATIKQQARNRRSSRYLTYDGKTMLLVEWAERIGISISTLHRRLKNGWTLERALSSAIGSSRDYRNKMATCLRHPIKGHFIKSATDVVVALHAKPVIAQTAAAWQCPAAWLMDDLPNGESNEPSN